MRIAQINVNNNESTSKIQAVNIFLLKCWIGKTNYEQRNEARKHTEQTFWVLNTDVTVVLNLNFQICLGL